MTAEESRYVQALPAILATIRAGAHLLLRGGRVIVQNAGKSITIGTRIAMWAERVNKLYELLPERKHTYLPTREYDISTGNFIYRWPNGDVTHAPPPRV